MRYLAVIGALFWVAACEEKSVVWDAEVVAPVPDETPLDASIGIVSSDTFGAGTTVFADVEFAIDFTLPECPPGYGELKISVPEGRYGDWSTIEVECGRIVDAD